MCTACLSRSVDTQQILSVYIPVCVLTVRVCEAKDRFCIILLKLRGCKCDEFLQSGKQIVQSGRLVRICKHGYSVKSKAA